MSPLPRDRHLFGPGRKRILSLDGGGVRGIVALAFLERWETVLAEAQGKPVRLCDHFDLIGGTSTGGLIATALALGYSAAETRSLYLDIGPRVFRKSWLRLPGVQAKFKAAVLRREIVNIVGDRTLGSDDLQTGLAVVLKRIDASGAWILSNNPRNKFWDTPPDSSFIGNRHYALEAVVRASAAAPSFFDLQPIEITAGQMGLFVDGSLTAHNDPALALFLIAVLPPHRLEWPLGPERLTLVSLGTGSYRERRDARALSRASALSLAIASLTQQIYESQQLTATVMSWLGDRGSPWPINSEIGDLNSVRPPFGPLFRYLRYDVRLETEWLAETLGLRLSAREVEALRRIDNPDALRPLDEIARAAAQRLVNPADIAAA